MFVIKDDKTICITRGDVATIQVTASWKGAEYNFSAGDVVRLRVVERRDYTKVVMQKDVEVITESPIVEIFLDKEDTRIGDYISKPTDYWYEIELNPDTMPQTIIGHDNDGAKIFRLFPEGADKK